MRALSAILAARLGRAALLPRMVPLGEADEAELDLAANPLIENGPDVLAPAMPPLERRLILARLVQKWAEAVDRTLLPIDDDVPFLVPSSPADAIGLAADLERLMDALTVEGLPWAVIGGAVEAEYSRYFGLTLDFVKIAAEAWPGILAERGMSDPVSRSRRLVLAEAERLTRERPGDPVIVAGSTGSVPATARLIGAVAGLPRGAVVLPGLDTDLDAAGWDAIETGEGFAREIAHGHPQAILHRLLGPGCLGLDRSRVTRLGEPDAEAVARAGLLSQALRPAETTEAWADLAPAARAALAEAGMRGLALVEAADEREEALIIAIALRETLETPGAEAALVTPDRGLAVRVAAELARWGIVAEDSGGEALSRSRAGRLARLAAELAADLTPARLITLLSHPFVRLGMPRSDVVRAAAALEIGVLRGPAPKPGFEGLRDALADQRTATGRRPRAKRRLTDLDWDLAAELLDRLELTFQGFLDVDHRGVGNLVAYAPAIASLRPADRCRRGRGDRGRLARRPRHALRRPRTRRARPPARALRRLPGLLHRARPRAHGRLLRRAPAPASAHPRAARSPPDAGGPRGARRPRRGRLADQDDHRRLPQPTDARAHRPQSARTPHRAERPRLRPGARHRDVVITRAAKREGAPTVPSRFLQRLRAFAGEAHWNGALQAGRRFSAYAAALDQGTGPAQGRLMQPKPKPDPALFPRSLSVTEVETLVRDPYVIFARHVLGLDPLEPVAAEPGAADRGTLIHDILGGFAERYPDTLPETAVEQLFDLALNAFQPISDTYPELYAEWWPRYERLAARFLEWEAERRDGLAKVHPEISGAWKIPMGAETFTLRARADRIERRRDGGACIVDFKTGLPPSNKEVFAGFSPQLTLEAAMLMAGAFEGLAPTTTTPDLLYVHASGGRKPFEPLLVKPPRGDEREVAAIVADHVTRFRGLVARFLAGEAAYTSRPYPKYAKSYGDYDHLARVLEWSLGGEGDA